MTNREKGGGASRSTEPAKGSSTGTDVSLREYFEALRHADDNLRRSEQRFEEERDRRYTERDQLRAEALKIKETADLAALGLAREIQTYKDEKANELREQISSERGEYMSRTEYTTAHTALQNEMKAAVKNLEDTIKPLTEYVTGARGQREGIGLSANVAASIVGIVLVVIGLIVTVYLAKHG